MVDVAVAAESLGFDSVWMGEHVISPDVIESRYPYHDADDDGPAFHSRLPFYDPYSALSFLAARTDQLKLVLSVSILPLHDPYHVARSVMTLDQFSGGRFVFGIGTGWLREEFEVVGAQWERRGARMDEMIELMQRLWSEPSVEFHGEFYDLPPSSMEPKPLTQPHPPLLFGGNSRVALRRTARVGDAWFGAGLDPEAAGAIVDDLRSLRAEAGRTDPVEISMNIVETPTPAEVEAYAEAGVDRLVVRPWERGRDAVRGVTAFADAFGVGG